VNSYENLDYQVNPIQRFKLVYLTCIVTAILANAMQSISNFKPLEQLCPTQVAY